MNRLSKREIILIALRSICGVLLFFFTFFLFLFLFFFLEAIMPDTYFIDPKLEVAISTFMALISIFIIPDTIKKIHSIRKSKKIDSNKNS